MSFSTTIIIGKANYVKYNLSEGIISQIAGSLRPALREWINKEPISRIPKRRMCEIRPRCLRVISSEVEAPMPSMLDG